MHRRVSWELAVKYLPIYIARGISDEIITDLAIQKVFFQFGTLFIKTIQDLKKCLSKNIKEHL